MKTLLLLAIVVLSVNNVRAQWTSNGPFGDNIDCLIASGSNIFAGTYNDGIFLYAHNGGFWIPVNNGLPNLEDDCHIYAFTIQDSNIFTGSDCGVFLSSDNGVNWIERDSGLTDHAVFSLAVSGSNLFAGTDDGVFLSTNNGVSWTRISNGMQSDIYINSIVVSGPNVFAAGYSGVYLSSNNAGSWTRMNNGLANTDVNVLALSGSNLFAGTLDSGIFVTTDNGANWSPVNTGLPPGANVTSLIVNGPEIFAGTYLNGVFLSDNNGASWTSVNAGLTIPCISSLAIDSSGVFAGTYNGQGSGAGGVFFFAANNEQKWTTVNNGFPGVNISSIATNGSSIIASNLDGTLYLSQNNGVNWIPVYSENFDSPIDGIITSDSNIFAAFYDSVIFSRNNGVSWTGLSDGSGNLYPVTWAPGNSGIFISTHGKGLFLLPDNGVNWVPLDTSLSNSNIRGLTVAGDDIFVVADTGLFFSNNNGTTWTELNTELNFGYIGFAFSGPDIFEYGENEGVLVSVDTGLTWREANTGLVGARFITSLVVSGSNIFASTDGGVFISENNGSNWYSINTGLPTLEIAALAVNETTLFAGTEADGVWQRSLSDITTGIKETAPPFQNNFKLYPNPANNSFILQTTSSTEQFMQVFDITGRLVLTQSIYSNNTIIDCHTLSAGIYMVSLKGENGLATQKLVLAR